MQLTKGAIGNLINRYKAVLKKCHLMNTFGSLAVAGMLVMGGAGVAVAESAEDFSNKEITGETLNSDASYLMGGYIQSSGKKLDEAKFLKNTITHTGNYLQGGIIKRSYAPELSITNSEFSGNSVSTTGYLQGGIINHDVATKTTNITKSKFNDNTILTTGYYLQGGIINNNGGTININDSEFNNNDMTSPSYLQGGIINNNGGSENVVVGIQNAKFNNNTINSNGFVQGGIIINDSSSGTSSINIVKSEFANNKINSQGSVTGGIILNDCTSTGDYLIAIDNTAFSKNEIHSEGNLSGSIINNQEDHKVTINSSSFESNISTVKGDYALGGAIYNKGELTFTGNNTFTDNIVNDKPNDIYNAGTITVADGTTTLNSGLKQVGGNITVKGGTLDMASGSSLSFDTGSKLTIDGGAFVADFGQLLTDYATTNTANGITDESIIGTSGNLNLRLNGGYYTLEQYNAAKGALLGQTDVPENATLNFLNATLQVGDGKILVAGADGNGTLTTGSVVVEKDSTDVSNDGTSIPTTPENYVAIVKDDYAGALLPVSTITTNGHSITAKVLKIADANEADAVTLKVTSNAGTNSTLTLVGDSTADTGVINESGQRLATKAVVEADNTLNMGLAGNLRDQGLTLTEATVKGTLNANGGVAGTTSEYAINTLTMEHGSKVNVLDSVMQIDKLNANGGTMFVDPSYVSIDGVNGYFNTTLLVGTGSTVNIGGMSTADLSEALTKAGMSVGPNFTVGASQSVLVLSQALTLGSAGKIVVDADVTDTGSISGLPGTTVATAYFGKDSLLVVNGSTINGAEAAIDLKNGSLNVQNGAKLFIADAVAGQTYTVITGETNTDTAFNSGAYNSDTSTGWKGDNLLTSSDMLTLTSTDGTEFTAKSEDAHTVFPNLSHELATAVNTLYGQKINDVDADAMGVRFLSRATDNRFLGADKDAAAATIESAARIAFAGAVPQMTKMASDAGSNAVVNRLGFANPADGAQAMNAEGKIVDRNTTGFALWIAPLWQSQHGWGMEADNLDYGFNGNLGGVSLGADYTFENAIRAGITFNIGGGYAESSGGDLNSTENRMSFWGLGAYAGWNYENFGLMADVSYTSTWNDLKQDMDSRMGMGDLEADVQASAISAGLRAEYKLETSVLDVIPHIGVRYMSLNTWGFDAESNGGTVLEGDGFHQDIWTFPVGVTFTKDFTLDSGWSFKPSIDFSVIPAAGDIKAKQDVAFTGLPGSYEVETQMMDYLTWQGGVGLEMGNDTMSFGVNYTLQAGQHTTGHGVFGSFRYEF